jgi:hypothetical protein
MAHGLTWSFLSGVTIADRSAQEPERIALVPGDTDFELPATDERLEGLLTRAPVELQHPG